MGCAKKKQKQKRLSCLGNKTFTGSSENMLDWGGECGRLNSQSSRCTFHLGSDGPLAYPSQRDLVHGGLQDVLWKSLSFPSKMTYITVTDHSILSSFCNLCVMPGAESLFLCPAWKCHKVLRSQPWPHWAAELLPELLPSDFWLYEKNKPLN